MSGDVQPRKRKDKRKRKDELGVEDARGTSALLGEGDVFIHYHHDHATGGHWCAKIIFFSLLAVLVTLIGLIILENRGLSELEANSVESRYSGVLEGWLEDTSDDDHHDKHTLELKHHNVMEIPEKGHNLQENRLDDENDELDDEPENYDDNDDQELESAENEDENGHSYNNYYKNDEENDDNSKQIGDDDDNMEEENDESNEFENDYESDLNNENERHEAKDKNVDNDKKYYSYSHQPEEDNGDLEDSSEVAFLNNKEDDDQDKTDNVVELENNKKSRSEFDVNDHYSFSHQPEEDDGDLEDSNELAFHNNEENDNDQDNTDSEIELENNKEISSEFYINDQDEYYSYGQNVINRKAPAKIDYDSRYNEKDDIEERNDEDDDEDVHDEEIENEVEKIEKEIIDEEPVFTELPTLPEPDNQDDELERDEILNEIDDDADDQDSDDNDEEFLESNDEVEPVVEHITAPAGKPFKEVEEHTSAEQPPGPDSLAEEEEYEKRQEELRREKAEASHMWLKLTVGGALLLATHAVMRRATRTHDTPVDPSSREETPARDQRLMLITEESPSVIAENIFEQEFSQETIVKPATTKCPPHRVKHIEKVEPYFPENIDEDAKDEEKYSGDEDDDVADDKDTNEDANLDVEVVSEEDVKEDVDADDVADDVEIIDDEQIEEELEIEQDDEDISDVDDTELLSRLEAKYGRLPEPERPGQKHKDGGNNVDDEWPGEPASSYWREELNKAEEELREGSWEACRRRLQTTEALAALRDSGRARWLTASALDRAAETKRDNRLLTEAIDAYLHLLKMNERLPDKKVIQVTTRALDRIQFRGRYLSAEPVYRLLIRRFPDNSKYRNQLSVSFLMANRADLAEEVLKETLKIWPNDRVALVHLAFVLKTRHNKLEEAVDLFEKALDGDAGAANEPRFYFHWGDSLLLLGRYAEAHEVHKKGAALGHFLSPAQRSLYNVDRLKGRPWWNVSETPYVKLARALERSWKDILKEGEAARALYEKEKEGLKERGEWSQLDLFVRGREIPDRCKRAPVTCGIVRSEAAAVGCRRGQIKFSSMEPGTHVRPHVGPTNCRLRMHLGLSNTKDTYLRVHKEVRQWQEGKVLLFDDSFEHEVWHNGTGTRLVLIVDLWHPDLTPAERKQLPAI